MKPLTRTIIVDSLAFAGFVLLTSTGILLHYLLPPGSGRRSTLWTLDRHDWGDVHFYIALASLAVLTVHLVLHRRWIAGLFRGHAPQGQGTRVAAGTVGLLALLAVAVGPLVSPVQRSSPATGVHGAAPAPAGTLRGSVTLQQVEDVTGMPPAALLAALGLPPDTPADEPLGRLAARHGIRMREVRAVIAAWSAAQAPAPE